MTQKNLLQRLGAGLARQNGVQRHVPRLVYGWGRTCVETARNRSLTVTKWVPSENMWHYHWPEGNVADEGRWRDAEGWATYGFYYGMSDLLWSRYRPREGDVVIDVGAGHGGETLFLANMVGPSGRVISVEAAPSPYGRLVDLVRRNGWSQVTPVQAALVAEAGDVEISDDAEGWIAGNIFDSKSGVKVEGRTIDALCEDLGIKDVDWLKMNIEGAEKEALRGMERMASHVKHMTISCHDFLGTEWGRSKDVVLSWLADHGFESEMRGEGDMVQQLYVYAWRANAEE